MGNQELNLIDSRKAKVNSDRASKFRKGSRRKDIVKKYLDKFGAKEGSIGENVTSGIDDFDFILNNIRNSISLEDREKFIREAERVIDEFKRSYDRILSDASLSSEDRDGIKKDRNVLVGDMQTKLADVINKYGDMLAQEENKTAVMTNELPEAKIGNEEDVYMNLEGNVVEADGLKNMAYVDYLCSVASSNGVSIRTIFESLVNGKKDVNVLTAEQFGSEKRGQAEAEIQRRIEEKNRNLESQLIDRNNEIAASNEKIARLEQKNRMSNEQNEQLVENANNLRREKNSLEQKVFEQDNTISELNKKNSELVSQVESVNSDNARKQNQIAELQSQVRNLNSIIEHARFENNDLRNELSRYVSEKDAEITELIKELNAREAQLERVNKILNGVTSNDDEHLVNDMNQNVEGGQGTDDIDKVRKGLEELSKVMNGAQGYDNSQEGAARVR